MDQATYDRVAEDIDNIVGLEHVNVTIDDQRLATLFYVAGMGFTRDPYLSVSDDNMWINFGRQQFHLPARGKPQVLRGHCGVVVPDLEALKKRLAAVREKLADRAYLVLGGPGWRLRGYFTSGALQEHLVHAGLVRVVTLEEFVAVANAGKL